MTDTAIRELRSALDSQAQELHALKEKVDAMPLVHEELAKLRADIQAMIDAWKAAHGVVKFVKWMGSLAMSMAAIYALFKLFFGGKL